MSSKYQGNSTEKLALDTYIKLMRSVDSVKKRIDAQNTVGELSGSMFGTLEMLYHLGSLNQKEIGEKLLVSKSNVVAVIDRLEKLGLAKRERSAEDRRCIFVHLTDAGKERIEAILPVHVAAISAEMNRLSKQEQEELGRLCRKLGIS